jgi:heptosyltransferase-2
MPRTGAPALAPTRLLIIRLDRLGDVVLSTSVAQELRRQFPQAVIAMMVRPACREVVEGHPALDAVLLYDKEGAQRSVWDTIQFARRLRRQAFDAALILHPTTRSHWIPWLAGIPVRIGYDRKCSWLLTHRAPHRKQEGARHEAAYALELLQVLGLQTEQPPTPLVRVSPTAAARAERLLAAAAVAPSDHLIAIHPSASCPSKRWLPERFAQVADRLIEQAQVKVLLVAGPDGASHARATEAAMRHRPINLAGKLSVGELAAVLQRCRLLVSNDSGPVHVAAAVGTPVVAIFGRNQPGLSSTRWGPLGAGHLVLQKDVGCVTCLAHRCDIGFLCLSELSVEEVAQAALRALAGADVGRTAPEPPQRRSNGLVSSPS